MECKKGDLALSVPILGSAHPLPIYSIFNIIYIMRTGKSVKGHPGCANNGTPKAKSVKKHSPSDTLLDELVNITRYDA